MLREPCGSHFAKPGAFTDFTDINLDITTIHKRNQSLHELLNSQGLYSINVSGDGNCYFRAISVCLFGSESSHSMLRQNICSHMASNNQIVYDASTSSQSEDFMKYIQKILTDGTWVGEDVIKASADFLNRDINVYVSTSKEPWVYKPAAISNNQTSPVRVAFLEPGHYHAVGDKNVLSGLPVNDNNIIVSNLCQGN